jgi:hypothetical protein
LSTTVAATSTRSNSLVDDGRGDVEIKLKSIDEGPVGPGGSWAMMARATGGGDDDIALLNRGRDGADVGSSSSPREITREGGGAKEVAGGKAGGGGGSWAMMARATGGGDDDIALLNRGRDGADVGSSAFPREITREGGGAQEVAGGKAGGGGARSTRSNSLVDDGRQRGRRGRIRSSTTVAAMSTRSNSLVDDGRGDVEIKLKLIDEGPVGPGGAAAASEPDGNESAAAPPTEKTWQRKMPKQKKKIGRYQGSGAKSKKQKNLGIASVIVATVQPSQAASRKKTKKALTAMLGHAKKAQVSAKK